MFFGFFNNLLLVSGVILIGGIVAFFIATRLLRLWVKKMDQRERRGGDFDMAELFELYEQGKLSAEEYERAKHAVVARHDRSAEPEPGRGFAVIPAGQQPAAPPTVRPPIEAERQ